MHTDAEGAFRVGGLAEGEHTLQFKGPPELPLLRPLRVRAGARGVGIRYEKGASVAITVLDPEGEPVAGAYVGAVTPAEWHETFNGRPIVVQGEDVAGHARTDVSGVARLAGLPPTMIYRLQVTPPDGLRGEPRGDLLRASIEEWRPKDETVRLGRDRPIRGVVRDDAGNAVAGAKVAWEDPKRPQRWTVVKTDDRGEFVLRELPDREVRVCAEMEGNPFGHRDGTAVGVRPGATDVVLRVDRGVDLAVKVENWPADAGRIEATLVSEGNLVSPIEATVDRDGTLTVRGVRPGTAYTLWIPPVGDGLSLLVEHLKPTIEPIAVRLVPGKTIRGRLRLPPGARDAAVWAERLMLTSAARGEVDEDGRFEIRGLPDGDWEVKAQARRGGKTWAGSARARAGGTVDVELTPP